MCLMFWSICPRYTRRRHDLDRGLAISHVPFPSTYTTTQLRDVVTDGAMW